MANELQAKITADISDLEKKLKKAGKSQEEFTKEVEKSSKGADNLKGSAQKLGQQLKSLGKDGQTASDSMADMASGLGQGGVLGAITLVIGAFSLLINSIKESQAEFIALAEAQGKAIGSAQAEISALQSLISIANDDTRSRKERQSALNQINAEYGDYLGNLSLDELATQGVTDKVNALTDALIRQAKIKGVEGLISKASQELFETMESGPIAAADNIDVLIAAFKSMGSVTGFTTSLVEEGFETQQKAISKSEKQLEKYKTLLNDLLSEDVASGGLSTKEGDKYAKQLSKQQAALSAKIAKEEERLVKEREKQRLQLIEIDRYVNDEIFRNAEQSTKDVAAVYATMAYDIERRADNTDIINSEKAFKNIQDIAKKIQEIQKRFPTLKLVETDFSGMNTSQLDAFSEKLEKIKNQTQVFSNVAGAALGGFSTKLADVFKTGNDILDASVAAIIKSGEQLLQELIKQSIQAAAIKKATAVTDIATNQAVATSNAIVAGSATAASSGPAAAFVLPALIGAAIGFIAASFAGLKFAHGGIVPGGSYTGDKVPAFLNSGEIVMNGRQQANTLMAIAEGNANHGKSTSKNDDITINAVLRGQNQIVQFNRASKFNKRFNG
jgi:hypothetical protein